MSGGVFLHVGQGLHDFSFPNGAKGRNRLCYQLALMWGKRERGGIGPASSQWANIRMESDTSLHHIGVITILLVCTSSWKSEETFSRKLEI